MNDIVDCLDSFKTYMFAYDLKFIRPIKTNYDVVLLQGDMDSSNSRFVANNMTINVQIYLSLKVLTQFLLLFITF